MLQVIVCQFWLVTNKTRMEVGLAIVKDGSVVTIIEAGGDRIAGDLLWSYNLMPLNGCVKFDGLKGV